MKTKIPQHKLHSDRIAQKWAILCCGTKGIKSINFLHKSKKNKDFQAILLLNKYHYKWSFKTSS
jgi:hypothetical protein